MKLEISIGVSDFNALRLLANRLETSPALMGQLAVRYMLDLDEDGKLPSIFKEFLEWQTRPEAENDHREQAE